MTTEAEAIATLAVALAGGHGWGIANWWKANINSGVMTPPQNWNWRKVEVMFLSALIVWGFAILTGHTVADVGLVLQQPQNAGFVVGLTWATDFVISAAIKWLKARSAKKLPSPVAPPA